MLKINNISSLQIFQLVRYGSLLLISVFFAQIGFSNTEIGNYESFMFVASAITFFWISGLIQSLLPLYNNKQKSELFFNASILLFIFSILSAIILFSFTEILQAFWEKSNIPYLNYIYIFIIINSPSLIIEYIYILINKPRTLLIFTLINHFVLISSILIAVFIDKNIIYAIYCFLFISLLRLIWLIILLNKYSTFKFSFDYIKIHLKLGYPLVLSSLISGFAQYFDGMLVGWKYNSDAFAIYRYGARELPIVMILANAFSNAMIPEFSKSKNLKSAINSLKQKSLKLIHILFPITIILLLTSNWLFPIVFNPSFVESANIFNVYLLIIISRLLFPQTILIGLKKTNMILIASTLEVIIHISLSIIFINLYGIIGVAYATIIAFFIEKLILTLYVKNKLNINSSSYIPFNWLIFYSILTIVIYILIQL